MIPKHDRKSASVGFEQLSPKQFSILLIFVASLSACSGATYQTPTVNAVEAKSALELSQARNKEAVKHRWSYAEMSGTLIRISSRLNRALKPFCKQVRQNSCHFRAGLVRNESFNAYADGTHKISIHTGLFKRLSSEDAVAFVVAHEFAHDLLDHRDKDLKNTALGAGVFAALSATGLHAKENLGRAILDGSKYGTLAFSPDMEAEADYVAAYALHNAGYDVQNGREALDVIVSLSGANQNTTHRPFTDTHPAPAERLASFEKTLREIKKGNAQPRLKHDTAPLVPYELPEKLLWLGLSD